MRYKLVSLVLIAGATGSSVADAGDRGVTPVLGGTACKTRAPVLLDPGRAPRAQLRFDLESLAGSKATESDIETTQSKRPRADGSFEQQFPDAHWRRII
jgi:hypothetical protein